MPLTTIYGDGTRIVGDANGIEQTLHPTVMDYVNIMRSSTGGNYSMSVNEIDAVNNMVLSLIAYGIWTKIKALYPIIGGTAAAHKFNLKDPRDVDAAFRLFFSGGWTHSSNGMQSNGTSSYANTFLSPSTNFTNNDTHLSVYPRLNTLGSSLCMIGTSLGATSIPLITIYQPSAVGAQIFDAYSYISAAGRIQITNPNYRGHLINSRISNNNFRVYLNGRLLSNNSNVSIDNVTNIISPIHIGSNVLNGTPGQFSNNQFAFASIGSGLTNDEALLFSNIVQAFQTKLGRQV
jgi:hypothetical protein